MGKARDAQQHSPDRWRSGKTTAERGYGGKWQRERERFLLSHPLCCYCEASGIVAAATVVDHKVPHRGDAKLFWDRKNWQPLCKRCHDSYKQRIEKSGAIPGCDASGVPTDPDHHWSK